MFVTVRFPVLVGLGVLPVILLTPVGADPWFVAIAWLVFAVLLALADAVAAPDPRALTIARSGPSRVLRGAPVETTLRLSNVSHRRLRGRVRDAWQPTAGAPTERMPLDVPPGESRLLRVGLLPRRRGVLRSAFVVVRTDGPLRIAGRQRSLVAPGSLRVLPAFEARRHLPSRLARLRELDGNTSVQVRGQGTEFDSLREYVRGDDVRSIDWRATARAGTTMLRTWRPERDRHVVIVVDTGRTAAARVGDGIRLDAAMESALLLSALAARAGDHVHLLMMDRAVRARVTRVDGPSLLPALVDAMAPVEAQLIDTDWDEVFAQVRLLTTRPSLTVLLTAQDSPSAARGFLGALPTGGFGTILVGSATDEPWRAPERLGAADVYRDASEARAESESAQVGRAIARASAEALTASPENLPPRIADRYLALKAAGRL